MRTTNVTSESGFAGAVVCWSDGFQIPDSLTVQYNPTQSPISYNNVVLPPNMLGIDGESYEVIVRWTAPVAGNYSIRGSFNGVGKTGCGQNSVDVGVYQDVTTVLAQGNISYYGQQYGYNISNVALSAGTTVDFTGTLANTYTCDMVGLIATVDRLSP
jgi:hypothetical protein